MAHVLVASPDDALRNRLAPALRAAGHEVALVSNAADLLRGESDSRSQIVLLDAPLSREPGFDLVVHLRARGGDTEVIVLADRDEIERAADLLRKGASIYLVKPVSDEDVVSAVDRASRRVRDAASIQGLERFVFEQVLGESPAMRRIAHLVSKVAPTDSSVLLTGESGTGKEILARTIHRLSNRSAHAFVAVNCGAIPETLLESELFGHVAGAFTGATRDKRGLFEEASRGTLFLDEIAETSPSVQVRLLRVLQDGEVRRVGDTKSLRVDVRILAATNRDLTQAVAERRFRDDLYYRLNVIRLHLPPLRERRDSLANLVRLFLARYGRERGRAIHAVSPEAWAVLAAYDFPGNIRELENIIQHACVVCEGDTILTAHLPDELLALANRQPSLSAGAGVSVGDPAITLAEMERRHVLAVLAATDGNQSLAAQRLGISRSTLWRKLKEFGAGDR